MKFPSQFSFINTKKSLYTPIILSVVVLFIIIYVTHIMYKSYKVANESFNDQEVKDAELYFFFANWCPHCKTAKPEMEKVKNNFHQRTINGYTIKVKYVDCSNDSQESKMLLSKYNVQGYPTVIMNVDDEVVEYDNKVTFSNIESFIGDVLK